MARDFCIFGACMVKVKGGEHLTERGGIFNGNDLPTLQEPTELGLTSDQIQITPVYQKRDVLINNFAGAPIDKMNRLAMAYITTNFVHFDEDVLDVCFRESLAGGGDPSNRGFSFGKSGRLLGNGLPMYASGNYLLGMALISTDATRQWRFPSVFVDERVVFPIGSERSIVSVTWGILPYVPYSAGKDYSSLSGKLWDYEDL